MIQLNQNKDGQSFSAACVLLKLKKLIPDIKKYSMSKTGAH